MKSLSLASVATLAVPAVAMASHDPELVQLIEAHDIAWRAFEEVCPLNDDTCPHYDPVNGQALWDWHCDAEEEARQSLLAHPVRSMTDLHLKVTYLFKKRGSDYLIEGSDDLEMLLLSLVRSDEKLNNAVAWIEDMRRDGFVFECHGDRSDPNCYHIFKDADGRKDHTSSLIAAIVAQAL